MNFTRLNRETPLQTGVNAALLSTSPDTNPIAINGDNQIVIYLDHINDGGALDITAQLQARKAGETTWRNLVTAAISSGVCTLSSRSIKWVIPAVAGTYGIAYAIGSVEGDQFRLHSITAVGAGAGDYISVSIDHGMVA